jgi:hypothetical protein
MAKQKTRRQADLVEQSGHPPMQCRAVQRRYLVIAAARLRLVGRVGAA